MRSGMIILQGWGLEARPEFSDELHAVKTVRQNYRPTAGKKKVVGLEPLLPPTSRKRLRLNLHHVAKHVPPPAHASPSCPASPTTTSSRVPCSPPPRKR